MAFVDIMDAPLAIDLLEKRVALPQNGAVLTFVGQVRNNSRNRDVAYLEYQVYRPLALKEMLRIAEEAEVRWSCTVGMLHRVGRIEIGEASVAIAVGSPHRGEGFEACRFCIDTLKETVPIWKREFCPDGSYWIEGEDAIPAL